MKNNGVMRRSSMRSGSVTASLRVPSFVRTRNALSIAGIFATAGIPSAGPSTTPCLRFRTGTCWLN